MPRHVLKPAVSRDSPYSKDCARSRVQKACDNCRRKKTKCDGASPCQKCKAENANCMFGDRKRHREKVYPKGYATFLEEQQGWLIHGIRELYRHVQAGDGWPGERLNCEANGQPLVHDMLSRLGSLNQPGSTIFQESEHNMTEPTSPYHQKLQDQPGHNKQRPHSSNGSQQSFTPIQRLPTTLNNILSSPTVHEGQHIEAMNTPSSSSVPDFTDAESIYIPLQIHTSSNLDKYDQSTPDPASHAGLLCNDVQPSSMLWYPTKNDSVGSDLFAGIGNHPDDWERFFNPSTQGQLSADGYSPFYDFQPLPFEYAT
ncbi:hypothetical protein N7465_010042 [Penicillium sp. CMV-2018d]|nr:hypothetical protein N7465_010042 [Penicillium sp. CMV-2018d]